MSDDGPKNAFELAMERLHDQHRLRSLQVLMYVLTSTPN